MSCLPKFIFFTLHHTLSFVENDLIAHSNSTAETPMHGISSQHHHIMYKSEISLKFIDIVMALSSASHMDMENRMGRAIIIHQLLLLQSFCCIVLIIDKICVNYCRVQGIFKSLKENIQIYNEEQLARRPSQFQGRPSFAFSGILLANSE